MAGGISIIGRNSNGKNSAQKQVYEENTGTEVFFKREQRNNSTDDMRGNVVRPVENRTSRTKRGPLEHDKH